MHFSIERGSIQHNYGLLTVKYDPNGNQLWINIPVTGLGDPLRVAGMAIDTMSDFYVA